MENSKGLEGETLMENSASKKTTLTEREGLLVHLQALCCLFLLLPLGGGTPSSNQHI